MAFDNYAIQSDKCRAVVGSMVNAPLERHEHGRRHQRNRLPENAPAQLFLEKRSKHLGEALR